MGVSRLPISSEGGMLDKYLEEIGGPAFKPLSREVERKLAEKMRQGDREAREALAKANLRFVVSVAKKYQGCGLPLADLIACGNCGLMEALNRFDSRKGYKFISYAVWWIRQAILQDLMRQGIKVPRWILTALKEGTRLTQEKGRRARVEEIAEAIGKKPEFVERALAAKRKPLSLDAPLNPDDNDRTLEEILIPGSSELMDEARIQLLKVVLEEALGTLDIREEWVIRLHFGFGSQRKMTLEEIGDLCFLTRERVRQIEQGSFTKLRRLLRQKKELLEFFLEPFPSHSPV